MRGNPHSKPEAFGPIPFIDVLFCRDGCTMLMPARECVTILLGLLFELAEIIQIFIIKYSTCQVFWLSISHALSNHQRIRRRRQPWEDGAGEEGRTPDLILGNYSNTEHRS